MSATGPRTYAATPSLARRSPVVFVIEDDISVRESLEMLIRSAGWEPRIFASALEFLSLPRTPAPSCMILDACLPDVDGLHLQQLVADRVELPVIFITAYNDVALSVRAMKAGAIEFLMKPINHDRLLDAIRDALDRSRVALIHEAEVQLLRDRYATLSRREREVMGLVVCGCLNKQIGAKLGISEITVKAHRGRVMRKMQARCLVTLINIAGTLGISAATRAGADRSPLPGH
jgi:FixJ family two-component response regulator